MRSIEQNLNMIYRSREEVEDIISIVLIIFIFMHVCKYELWWGDNFIKTKIIEYRLSPWSMVGIFETIRSFFGLTHNRAEFDP